MLTEVSTTSYAIKVRGQIVVSNIPSIHIAEATLFGMAPDQRAIAEIVTMTPDGKSLLLG